MPPPPPPPPPPPARKPAAKKPAPKTKKVSSGDVLKELAMGGFKLKKTTTVVKNNLPDPKYMKEGAALDETPPAGGPPPPPKSGAPPPPPPPGGAPPPPPPGGAPPPPKPAAKKPAPKAKKVSSGDVLKELAMGGFKLKKTTTVVKNNLPDPKYMKEGAALDETPQTGGPPSPPKCPPPPPSAALPKVPPPPAAVAPPAARGLTASELTGQVTLPPVAPPPVSNISSALQAADITALVMEQVLQEIRKGDFPLRPTQSLTRDHSSLLPDFDYSTELPDIATSRRQRFIKDNSLLTSTFIRELLCTETNWRLELQGKERSERREIAEQEFVKAQQFPIKQLIQVGETLPANTGTGAGGVLAQYLRSENSWASGGTRDAGFQLAALMAQQTQVPQQSYPLSPVIHRVNQYGGYQEPTPMQMTYRQQLVSARSQSPSGRVAAPGEFSALQSAISSARTKRQQMMSVPRHASVPTGYHHPPPPPPPGPPGWVM